MPAGICGNRILAALARKEYDSLSRKLGQISLPVRHVLHEPGQAIDYAYFPLHGAVCLIAVADGRGIAAGQVGNEGFIGGAAALGNETSRLRALSQLPGEALRIRASVLRAEVESNRRLAALLRRYVSSLLAMIAQGVACNRVHPLERRLVRWLLMTHDRAGSDEFPATQDFLAQMLAVRRAGVSEIASRLQAQGLIRYHRGRMAILNRASLETCACECYGILRRELEWLSSAALR